MSELKNLKQRLHQTALKSLKGAQRYELPADVELTKYKSLLLHCEKYSKLWGAGEL